MKRTAIELQLYAFAALTAFGQGKEMAKKSKKAKGNTSMTADLPYTADYSSNFSMGKPQLAKMILDLHKDYESADWSKDSWFSDTLMAIFPDGNIIQGKDAVLEAFKKEREANSAISFRFDAIIPLMSVDRNEDWVALWGTETITSNENGATPQHQDFQSVWKINKDDKVAFIRFFNAKTPM